MTSINNQDIIFIINPNSGNKKGLKVLEKIKSLDKRFSYVVTNNLTEFEAAFTSNIEKYKIFIVVGGDGTVSESIKYIYNREDKILGVLPTGSGNGFSKELGFGNSLLSLIEDALKGESIDVDILSINDEKCINVAGVGLDGFIAHHFDKSNTRGFKKYVLETVKAAFAFKPFTATLTVDDEEIHGKFQMISIANTRQFGNNAFIAPEAKPNSGVFDLVMVKPFPFYLYPAFIKKLFTGTLKDAKYIRYVKVQDKLKIKSNFNQYHVDGEPRTAKDNISVTMLKKKVRILKTQKATT